MNLSHALADRFPLSQITYSGRSAVPWRSLITAFGSRDSRGTFRAIVGRSSRNSAGVRTSIRSTQHYRSNSASRLTETIVTSGMQVPGNIVIFRYGFGNQNSSRSSSVAATGQVSLSHHVNMSSAFDMSNVLFRGYSQGVFGDPPLRPRVPGRIRQNSPILAGPHSRRFRQTPAPRTHAVRVVMFRLLAADAGQSLPAHVINQGSGDIGNRAVTSPQLQHPNDGRLTFLFIHRSFKLSVYRGCEHSPPATSGYEGQSLRSRRSQPERLQADLAAWHGPLPQDC